jgi:hypothetical protein
VIAWTTLSAARPVMSLNILQIEIFCMTGLVILQESEGNFRKNSNFGMTKNVIARHPQYPI